MSFDKIKETRGRMLGIDFGEARTGIAVSDVSRLLASGIGNIKGGGLERSVEAIAEVVERERISAIILGLPVMTIDFAMATFTTQTSYGMSSRFVPFWIGNCVELATRSLTLLGQSSTDLDKSF